MNIFSISKIRYNKKGEDMLVDFFAILIFVVILIIFLLIFLVFRHQTTQDTLSDFKSKDAAFMLDSFIRAKYLPDQSKTMGEIIGEDAMHDDFSRTDSSFKHFFTGIDDYTVYESVSFSLCISKSGSKLDSVDQIGKLGNFISTWLPSCIDYSDGKTMNTISSSTIIPGADGDPITVMLTVRFNEDPKKSQLTKQ